MHDEEGDRRAAAPQAGPLERGDLVEAAGQQDGQRSRPRRQPSPRGRLRPPSLRSHRATGAARRATGAALGSIITAIMTHHMKKII